MEKYGFVYIWYDKKHKRFYIGCRWGNIDDGYICSSPIMKKSFKRRPHDFKRRILTMVYTNRKDLLEEEYRFLRLMKKEELGKKYYNLHNHHFDHWTSNKQKYQTISKKISQAHKGKHHSPATEFVKGDCISPQTQFKKGQIPWNKGKKDIYSEETKKLMSEKKRGKSISPQTQFKKGQATWNKGKPWSEETKLKMSLAKKKHINNELDKVK